MQTSSSISLEKLDLPFAASSAMTFHDARICDLGDKIVVGYLSDDSDCENPLESSEGQGRIYSAHRNARTHSEMQDALALDSSWNPDLDLVDQHMSRLRSVWISAAMCSREFIAWADETAGARAAKDDAYYKRRAEKLWRETGGEYIYGADSIHNFEFTDDVRTELWRALRSEGLIGDKDAVVLDCYEHSGQSWSLAGEGMQCRWDTARGAGVWVPDNCAREEIDRRAKAYAFGRIETNGNWTFSSGKLRYIAILDGAYAAARSPEFEQWHEAFQWLDERSKKLKLATLKGERAQQVRRGRERAAREIARDALEEYNNWLSGDCYGVVAAVFSRKGEGDDSEWEFVESDECWGYIGSDYAIEEAEMTAKNLAESLKSQVQA